MSRFHHFEERKKKEGKETKQKVLNTMSKITLLR